MNAFAARLANERVEARGLGAQDGAAERRQPVVAPPLVVGRGRTACRIGNQAVLGSRASAV